MVAERMHLRATSVTIGAPNPRELAGFYAAVLGVEVSHSDPPSEGEPRAAGWAQIKTASLTLNFEFERCWQPPVWPARPERPFATQHLDIWVQDTDLDAAVGWAVQCGARLCEVQPQEDVRVLVDPAGHPFCLFR